MHSRPTLTMRPAIKPQDCKQNVSSRETTSIKSADIQDKKPQASQDIIGHSANDNHIAAQTLKSMLSQSIDSENAALISDCDTMPTAPLARRELDEYLQVVCDTASQRMLRTAFEQVYSDRMGGYRFGESGSHDQTALWKQLNNHVLGQRQPAHPSRVTRQAARFAADPCSSKGAPYGPASHPPAPLRESTGESISRSQERGAGVIGNPASLPEELGVEVLQTEVGCDLALYRGQELCANVDSHLPNLAFHHTARIRNSIIHALEPHKQPIIKWDYHHISRKEDGK